MGGIDFKTYEIDTILKTRGADKETDTDPWAGIENSEIDLTGLAN